MDVVQQVLQILIHARFRIDRRLLRSDQVIELNYTNAQCLILLRLQHQLTKLDVLNKFLHNDVVKVGRLCEVPPVFAREGGVGVVAQVLLCVKH